MLIDNSKNITICPVNALNLGFALDEAEVAELLSLEDGQHCWEAIEIALRKLILIRERIEGLRTMETALSNFITMRRVETHHESVYDYAFRIECLIFLNGGLHGFFSLSIAGTLLKMNLSS